MAMKMLLICFFFIFTQIRTKTSSTSFMFAHEPATPCCCASSSSTKVKGGACYLLLLHPHRQKYNGLPPAALLHFHLRDASGEALLPSQVSKPVVAAFHLLSHPSQVRMLYFFLFSFLFSSTLFSLFFSIMSPPLQMCIYFFTYW